MMLIDSYTDTDSAFTISAGSGRVDGAGQSFNADAGYYFTSAKFRMRKESSPTGTIYAKLYAHTGTFGTNGTPTGSALESIGKDVSTLGGTYAEVTFDFAGTTLLTKDANYFICLEYAGGDADNYVPVSAGSSSPTHEGNSAVYNGSSWSTDSKDLYFKGYGTVAEGSATSLITISSTAQKETFYWLEEPTVRTTNSIATHVKVKSPTANYTANNSPTSGSEIYKLVSISEGDATICQNVAEQLLARWGSPQVSVTGTIPLNLILDFKQKIRVKIDWANIDEDMILQKKEHDIAVGTTTLTLGDIILDDAELIARIIDDLI